MFSRKKKSSWLIIALRNILIATLFFRFAKSFLKYADKQNPETIREHSGRKAKGGSIKNILGMFRK